MFDIIKQTLSSKNHSGWFLLLVRWNSVKLGKLRRLKARLLEHGVIDGKVSLSNRWVTLLLARVWAAKLLMLELVLDLVHWLEELNVVSALVNDLSSEHLAYLLVLCNLHEPLHRLVHVLFAQLFELLEFGLHLGLVSIVLLDLQLMLLQLLHFFIVKVIDRLLEGLITLFKLVVLDL